MGGLLGDLWWWELVQEPRGEIRCRRRMRDRIELTCLTLTREVKQKAASENQRERKGTCSNWKFDVFRISFQIAFASLAGEIAKAGRGQL